MFVVLPREIPHDAQPSLSNADGVDNLSTAAMQRTTAAIQLLLGNFILLRHIRFSRTTRTGRQLRPVRRNGAASVREPADTLWVPRAAP